MIKNRLEKALLIVSCYIAGFLISARVASNNFFCEDTWWHIAVGKWIYEHRTMIRADPFSWSLPNAHYVDHEWLFQVLLYIFSDNTLSVIIFCSLPIFMAISIEWTFLKKCNPIVAGILLLIVVQVISIAMTARPQLFDLAFFAAIIFFYKKRNIKWLYCIPIIILIWANMHSAVVLGIVVIIVNTILCFIPSFESERLKHVQGPRKEYLIITILSVIFLFATPLGIELPQYVIKTMTETSFKVHVQEWLPIQFGNLNLRITFVVFIVTFVIGLLIKKNRISLNSLILCGGLMLFAFSSWRFYAYFGIVMAELLGELWKNEKEYNHHFIRTAIGIGIILSCVGAGIPNTFDSAAKEYYPLKALSHINKDEKVLNHYNWGGYLIYKGYPVFVDGRADMYTWEGKVFKDYMEVLHGDFEINKVIKKYKPDKILIYKDSILDKFLSLMPEFKKIYSDKLAVVYKVGTIK